MMGFYGYASRGSRHLSYALMRQLAHESNLLWVVVGDFNELLGPYEKIGRLPHLLYLCNKFKNALDDCLLQDFGFLGHRFTWEKWQRFNQSRMVYIPISSSNHLPIFLELKHFVKVYRRRRFRYENLWSRKEECGRIVKESWGRSGGLLIQDRLEQCGGDLDN
uniref:Endonuclease/exonuclease/phosphatase domain-containing protein n=1 Tax=Manihot esculenta TaxID=3983 RepID=A0A2C9VDC1_MANES